MKNFGKFRNILYVLISLVMFVSFVKSAEEVNNKPFSKHDYIDPDFYATLDLTEVKQKINENLNHISNVCKLSSLRKKIAQVQNAFQNIRTTSQPYLKKHNLSILDQIFLSSIVDAIDPNNILYGEREVTVSLVQRTDLAQSFFDYYSVQHNLPDAADKQDLLDPWAKQIMEGLGCLHKS